MSLFIYKKAIGMNRNLLLENGEVCWTSNESQSASATFTYGSTFRKNSIEPLLDLYNIALPELIPDNFREAMRVCGLTANIPWSEVLPKKQFMKRFRALLDSLLSAEKTINNNEYSSFFIKTNEILYELKSCGLDHNFIKAELSKNDSAALKTFTKLDERVPSYSRVSTKTGRLTIKKGPQILTLKKEYRQALESSFSDGSLYEIDFTSLEPRVAFNITAEDKLFLFPDENSPDDLYQFFIEKAQVKIKRDTAKLAVLCALYGAGTTKLRSVLQKDNSTFSADVLIRRVEYFFGLKALTKMLNSQAPSGYITNFYGRPIEVTDSRKNVLVNNFLQSTAVDVALAGFCEIIQNIPSCKPVFIIHDALIMDVPKGQEESLQEIVTKGFYDEKLGHFPLKLTRLK